MYCRIDQNFARRPLNPYLLLTTAIAGLDTVPVGAAHVIEGAVVVVAIAV